MSMKADSNKIIINVSGQRFVTSRETLARYPTTKIGELARRSESEHFFDADEEVFREILRYHRTGELHAPRNICLETFYKHLEFWGLSKVEVEECCRGDEINNSKLEDQFLWFERRIVLHKAATFKDRIWYFMTDPKGPYTKHRCASITWALIYCFITIAQTVNIAILTIPKTASGVANETEVSFQTLGKEQLDRCETFKEKTSAMLHEITWKVEEAFFMFFLFEIVVRFSCCPSKRRFCISIHMVDLVITFIELLVVTLIRALWLFNIDLTSSHLCSIISILAAFMELTIQMRCARLLAIATIFSQLRVLLLTIYNSKTEIALLISTLGISSLIFGPAIFYMENLGNLFTPDSAPNLTNIPIAYWWAIVTMTTVGYGDYYPTNVLGYMFAAVIMMFGLIVTALPVAIIGSNFTIYYEYNQKRQKRLKHLRNKTKRTEKKDFTVRTSQLIDEL